jgi:hypothetical protein
MAIAPNGNKLIKFMVVKNAQPMNKSCMNFLAEDVVYDPNRIKKDALYKPLLRKFRTYLRFLIDESGFSQGCQHLTLARILKKVKQFMIYLDIPEHFMNTKSQHMMTLILFPFLVKKSAMF